jgi:hypothetical protein
MHDLWAEVPGDDLDDLMLSSLGHLRAFARLKSPMFWRKKPSSPTTPTPAISPSRGGGRPAKDDARAVDAYRTLLTLQPDDRRAGAAQALT